MATVEGSDRITEENRSGLTNIAEPIEDLYECYRFFDVLCFVGIFCAVEVSEFSPSIT